MLLFAEGNHARISFIPNASAWPRSFMFQSGQWYQSINAGPIHEGWKWVAIDNVVVPKEYQTMAMLMPNL